MSVIDSLLNDRERHVLEACRTPRCDIRRALRLSIQYAIAAAVFVYLAIVDTAWWSLGVYVIFLAWMVVRLFQAQAIAGVMPSVIEKYENRIRELEGRKTNSN